ncbi:MAG: 30S ribosomal protein S7 [Patescibacteria group bacterium]|nr:30S ribosomal protein S7 [Patescibacteria group bacterium]MBU2068346.1 30S ribosomal protein S7 [Patescibacteria group bacterium]
MRRKRNVKRDIEPDFRYNNTLVAKFTNHLMKEGKKSVAQKVLYGAFDYIEKNNKGKDALEVFDLAIKNTSPLVEVRSRRIGGARYQVPREVRGERKIALAMRWILKAARGRTGKPMYLRLAEELLNASKNEGEAVKKKQETHKIADANKAFAHFGW